MPGSFSLAGISVPYELGCHDEILEVIKLALLSWVFCLVWFGLFCFNGQGRVRSKPLQITGIIITIVACLTANASYCVIL